MQVYSQVGKFTSGHKWRRGVEGGYKYVREGFQCGTWIGLLSVSLHKKYIGCSKKRPILFLISFLLK